MNTANRALMETTATIRAQLESAEQALTAHTAKLNQALGKRRALSRALRAAERAIERDTAHATPIQPPPEDQPPLSFPPIHGTVAGIAKAWLDNQAACCSPEAEGNEALNEVLTASWHALDRALIETPAKNAADALGLVQVAVKNFEMQHSTPSGLELPDDDEARIRWAALNAAQKLLPDAGDERLSRAPRSLESRVCDLQYAAHLMVQAMFEVGETRSAAQTEKEERQLCAMQFAVGEVSRRIDGLVRAYYLALKGNADDAYGRVPDEIAVDDETAGEAA